MDNRSAVPQLGVSEADRNGSSELLGHRALGHPGVLSAVLGEQPVPGVSSENIPTHSTAVQSSDGGQGHHGPTAVPVPADRAMAIPSTHRT